MQPTPSASAAIQQTLLWTIQHNLPVMIYVFGILLILALMFYRPSRRLVLYLVGFALLTLNFEYVKHIAEPLLEQTQNAVGSTGYESAKATKFMDIVFQHLIPLATLMGGWAMILLGILFDHTQRPKNNEKVSF